MPQWLHKFQNVRKKYKHSNVFCQECQCPVNFQKFGTHVKTVHPVALPARRHGCEYCFYARTWSYGEAKTDAVCKHRIQCIEKLIRRLNSTVPCTECYQYHSRRENQPHYLGHRTKRREWGSFYDPVEEDDAIFRQVEHPHVSFTESSGLGNVAHNIVKLFQQPQYKFYHVIVRQIAWSKFLELNFDRVHFTRYWCLCDSTKCKLEEKQGACPTMNPEWVHHRHMVVMVESGAELENVWRYFKVGNYPCKTKIALNTLLHLINALCYVSSHRSTRQNAQNPLGNHYWINCPMAPHAILAWAVLYKEGLKQILRQKAGKYPVRGEFLLEILEPDETCSQLRVAIRHLNVRIVNCVIPFARGWEWSSSELQGPIVYGFDREMGLVQVPGAETLTEEEWYMDQIRKKHCFLNMIHDKYYELTKPQTNEWQAANQVVEMCDEYADDYEKRKADDPVYVAMKGPENALKRILGRQQKMQVDLHNLKREMEEQTAGHRSRQAKMKKQLTEARDRITEQQNRITEQQNRITDLEKQYLYLKLFGEERKAPTINITQNNSHA